MTHTIRTLAAVAVAATLCGCIESTTIIVVAPDGSGSVTETVHVNRAAERMLSVLANVGRGLANAQDGTAEAAALPPSPPRAFYEERAAAMGAGVSLLELKPIRRGDGVVGLTAVYGFADVRVLRVPVDVLCPGLFPVYGSPEEITAMTTRDTVRFELFEGSPRQLLVRLPWAEEARESLSRTRPPRARAVTSQDEMALWRHVLSGFHVRMFVRTASPMLRTDATMTEADPLKPEERLVKLFELSLGETVRTDAALDRLTAAGPVATMNEALARYAGVPGARVETRDSVTIEF